MARSGPLTARPRAWIAPLVATVIIVAIAATTLVARVGAPWASGGGALVAPVRIATLTSAHLACPVDPSFSPDGAHVVLLGALESCRPPAENAAPVHWALAIFSTATGALERRIPLDPLLHGADESSADDAAGVTRYASLGWSPDGARIAVVYTAFSGPTIAPEQVEHSGLLLVNTATGEGRALRGDSGYFSALSGLSEGYPIWNTRDGTEKAAYLPEPGLAYAWNLDGAPTATQPLRGTLDTLPVIAGPRYPVGAPAGGSRFTLWQPGLVIGRESVGAGSARSVFVTLFPTWSEDGTWLTVILVATSLQGASSREAPSTGAAPLAPYPIPASLASIPTRDAALDATLKQVGARGWAVVAWSPSGAALASVACFAGANPPLQVRDTTTGNVLAEAPLTLPGGDSGCRSVDDGEADAAATSAYPRPHLAIHWSPDGGHLLVSDRDADTVTIWQVGRTSSGA